MSIYYIDYENVSSQGLKGIESLTKEDEVNILYSKKADNVKIDILTMLMKSPAEIHFLPVHVGTPNALDFQLVTLLFLHYKQGTMHYIISKDSGYDCCLKTAAENGAEEVARYANIESALNGIPPRRTRRGRRGGSEELNVYGQGSGKGAAASEDPAGKEQEPLFAAQQTAQTDSDSAAQQAAVREDASEKTNTNQQPEASASPAPDKTEGGEQPKKRTRRGGRGRKRQTEQDPAQRQGASEDTASSNAAPSHPAADQNKPVTILAVIRRRNDVQLDMHQIDLIRDALRASSTKQQFYNYFVKQLGQKKGIELYHQIKSSYTDLVNAKLI